MLFFQLDKNIFKSLRILVDGAFVIVGSCQVSQIIKTQLVFTAWRCGLRFSRHKSFNMLRLQGGADIHMCSLCLRRFFASWWGRVRLCVCQWITHSKILFNYAKYWHWVVLVSESCLWVVCQGAVGYFQSGFLCGVPAWNQSTVTASLRSVRKKTAWSNPADKFKLSVHGNSNHT